MVLCNYSIRVQYESPVASVYLEAAKCMVFEEQTLEFMAVAGADLALSNLEQLKIPRTDLMIPSWVPDFHAWTSL